MKFINKIKIIEATQFTKEKDHPAVVMCGSDDSGNMLYAVRSVQGMVPVYIGDWIITERDCIHHYPCRPEIFELSYELLPQSTTHPSGMNPEGQ